MPSATTRLYLDLWVLLGAWFELALSMYIVTAIHEGAHAFAASRRGAHMQRVLVGRRVRLTNVTYLAGPFGGASHPARQLTRHQRLWPILAGPLASLAFAAVLTLVALLLGPPYATLLAIPTGWATLDLHNLVPRAGRWGASDGYLFCYFQQNRRSDPPEPQPPYPRLKNTPATWALRLLPLSAVVTLALIWLAMLSVTH